MPPCLFLSGSCRYIGVTCLSEYGLAPTPTRIYSHWKWGLFHNFRVLYEVVAYSRGSIKICWKNQWRKSSNLSHPVRMDMSQTQSGALQGLWELVSFVRGSWWLTIPSWVNLNGSENWTEGGRWGGLPAMWSPAALLRGTHSIFPGSQCFAPTPVDNLVADVSILCCFFLEGRL